MPQCVERALIAKPAVEGRSVNQHVRRQHAARVIRDNQRTAMGRQRFQTAYLKTKPALRNRPPRVHQPLGEVRVPLANLGAHEIGANFRCNSVSPRICQVGS
jgi:hypothetical protein